MSTWEPHAPSAGPRSAGAAGGPGVHFATGDRAGGRIDPVARVRHRVRHGAAPMIQPGGPLRPAPRAHGPSPAGATTRRRGAKRTPAAAVLGRPLRVKRDVPTARTQFTRGVPPEEEPRTACRRRTLASDARAGLVLGVERWPDGLASGLLAGSIRSPG